MSIPPMNLEYQQTDQSEPAPWKILALDDVETDSVLILRALRKKGMEFSSRYAQDEAALRALLVEYEPDLVLSDFSMPGFTGLDALDVVKEKAPGTPLIIVTGALNEETAADCIKAGARDYVLKDNLTRLAPAVQSAIEMKQLQTAEQKASREARDYREFAQNVFNSSMDAILTLDIDLKITEMNQAAIELFRQDKSKLCPQNAEVLFKDKAAGLDLLGQILRSGATSLEIELKRESGVFPAHLSASPLLDTQNSVLGIVCVIKDISTLVETKEQLRKSEEYFRLLFENAPDTFYIHDLEGRLIDFNRAGERMLGIPREAGIGNRLDEIDFLPEDQLSKVSEGLSLSAAGKATGPRLYTLKHADGSNIHAEVRTFPVTTEGNQLVLGIARDVTEQHRQRRLIADSERRLRAITESAADGIISMDADGNIIALNRSAQSIFRCTEEEVLGTPASGMLSDIAGNGDVVRGLLKRVGKSRRRGETVVMVGTRKDMESFPLELSLSTWKLDGKRRYTAIIRDITTRMKAQHDLEESEEKYRMIVENAHEGIEITQDDRIIFTNPRFAEMLGYTVNDLLGQPFSSFHTRRSQEALRQREQLRSAGKEVPPSYETTFMKKNGEIIDVLVNWEIIDYKGKPATFAMVQDITEAKRARRMLEQNLQEKETLVREIHHRVKNNMQILISLLSMQRERTPEMSVQNVLDTFKARIRAMAAVHEHIYNDERLDRIDFTQVVNYILLNLLSAPEFRTMKVDADIDIQIDQLPLDLAMPMAMIIHEIVSNSITHAFDGEETPTINLCLRRSEANQLELSVSDNGCGFDVSAGLQDEGSMGLYLIDLLVKHQINGSYDLKKDNGTHYTIHCPEQL